MRRTAEEERILEAVNRVKRAAVAYIAKRDPWELKDLRYWANVLNREVSGLCDLEEKVGACSECGRGSLYGAMLCPACVEDD